MKFLIGADLPKMARCVQIIQRSTANLSQHLTGFGTLIQLINTLQVENAALKTDITNNEANIEINNNDIKANAASIVSLLFLEHLTT